MAKQSAFLMRLQAAQEREAKLQRAEMRENLGQIDIMALLMAAHECLGVGPGRAGKLLRAFLDAKQKIAADLIAEVGDSYKGGNGDVDFLKFRRDMAREMKHILSPDDWEQFKELLPVLGPYWEVDI